MTVLEKDKVSNGKWNYEMMLQTVNILKGSQGFYSRMASTLYDMDEYEKGELMEQLDRLPKFNDTLDVVMFLEG